MRVSREKLGARGVLLGCGRRRRSPGQWEGLRAASAASGTPEGPMGGEPSRRAVCRPGGSTASDGFLREGTGDRPRRGGTASGQRATLAKAIVSHVERRVSCKRVSGPISRAGMDRAAAGAKPLGGAGRGHGCCGSSSPRQCLQHRRGCHTPQPLLGKALGGHGGCGAGGSGGSRTEFLRLNDVREEFSRQVSPLWPRLPRPASPRRPPGPHELPSPAHGPPGK